MSDVVVGVDLGSSSARAVAIDRAGTVVADSAAGYAGANAWPPGRADPLAFVDAFEDAIARLPVTRCDAIAIGGQSPTTVLADGTDAITCLHPAGATLDPHAQHGEQYRVLRDKHGEEVEPLQLWDFVLTQLGAPKVQGRWPGDPELPGYGSVVDNLTSDPTYVPAQK